MKFMKATRLLILGCLMALVLCGCSNQRETMLKITDISTWNMPPDGARIPSPRAITVGLNGEILCVDDAGRVLVFDKHGQLKRQWMMPESELGHPEGIVVLRDGRIAVSDTHYNRLVIFKPDGTTSAIIGHKGVEPGEFTNPVGITQDDDGALYVCEYGERDRAQKLSMAGNPILSFGESGAGDGQFQRPASIRWRAGKVYVVDAVNNRIQVFTDKGKFLKVLGADQETPPSFYLPYDMTFGPDGSIYVIEYGGARLGKLSPEGKVIGHFGKPGANRGEFKTPWGVAVDREGTIYVADTGNRRIVVLKEKR